MNRKKRKEGLLTFRIEHDLKEDFEDVMTRNCVNRSKLLREWVTDYVNQNKYRYFEIKNSEFVAIVRAIGEKQAYDLLSSQYSHRFETDVNSALCKEVTRNYALTMFVSNVRPMIVVGRDAMMLNTEELLSEFENTKLIVLCENNLYYYTTKEQLEREQARLA